MKIGKLKIAGIAVVAALIFSSCIDVGDENHQQTKAEELQILNAYIDSLQAKDYDVDTTDLGVYYVVIEEGEGDYPQEGDTLIVGYSGYLMDGYMFDSSEVNFSDGKWEFVLGNPPMIPGWDDGVTHINKGGKIQFIVPSELGYGALGQGIIGPYQSLIFVVKMYDIKPSNEE